MSVTVLLSEGDDGALQLGLSLGAVTVLRAGPPEDDALLQRALAAGARRAVRLWDPVLSQTDEIGLGTALAAAARTLGSRLVVAGDGSDGAVGPTVAERLDLPHLCGVLGAEWLDGAPEDGARQLQVERRTLSGRQRLRGPGSVVLCVAAGVAQLPIPAGRAPGPISQLGLYDVGLSVAELGHRRWLRAAPGAQVERRGAPRSFASAEELIARLRHDGLLPRE